MSFDVLKTIGSKLKDEWDAQRDAIHIAIMPVIAGESYLRRGQSVRFAFGTNNTVVKTNEDGANCVGIIDPFLDSYSINKGDKIWMFLNPRTVTGMRHQWQCPAVDKIPEFANESERWIREFAHKWNFNYDELIANAIATNEENDWRYITAMGMGLHSAEELEGDHDLFWEHLATLTGKTFDKNHRDGMTWSCSC